MMADCESDEDFRRFDTMLWAVIEEGVPEDVVVAKIWEQLGDDPEQIDGLMEHLRIYQHNMLDDARIPAWEDEGVYGEQRARGARLAPLVGRVIAALVQRMAR